MVEAAGIETTTRPDLAPDNTGQPRTEAGQDQAQPGQPQELTDNDIVAHRTGTGQAQDDQRCKEVHNICITASNGSLDGMQDQDGTLARIHEMWATLTPEARRLIVQVAESVK